MDLLFKTEPQIFFHDDIMVENNGDNTDMAKLLRMLCAAECVVRKTDLDNDVGSTQEYVDLFESNNGVFTPSINDLASVPPSRHTVSNPLSSSSAITNRSVVISNYNIIRSTDPFEPTPIGPRINVVRDVPISSLFGDRVPPPNDYIPWPAAVNAINSNSSEDIASMEPLSLVTASSIIKNKNTSLPISTSSSSNNSSNNRKFQDEQWKQRFQDLLEFQQKHGHLLVPHAYSDNNKLSQWVKR
jgi:Helicase associated domain